MYAEVQSVYQAQSLVISSTYFPILRLLQTKQGLSVMDIAEQLGLSHPAVSKQVSKMLKERLLEKVADPADQRRSIIVLSDLSHAQMTQVEPVLEAIGTELNYFLGQLEGDFLTQLSDLESSLLTQPYAERVLLRLTPDELSITALASDSDAQSFKALNMQWLERFFAEQIYAQDIDMLERPQAFIAQGAVIKCARFKNRVVGCYLIKPNLGDSVELCKLAVAEEFAGLGIGKALVEDAIKEASKLGASKLTLETHTSLRPAIELYQQYGFKEVDCKVFSVPRADLKMVRSLPAQEVLL
nr:bifunctional helix-turn-helix transcriptional regulator/GNAT family N-acetyltransferase [Marinomonas ostreistagni]